MQALFAEYNQRYFGGKLPHYRVELMKELGVQVDGQVDKKRRVILILETLREQRRTAILLHEMAHVATNVHHGKKWCAEMQRLADAGVPVDLEDLTLDIPLKERLMTYATVFVADHPDGLLEQFEQYVVERMVGYFDATRRSP